jgi:hypothetical protein
MWSVCLSLDSVSYGSYMIGSEFTPICNSCSGSSGPFCWSYDTTGGVWITLLDGGC